MAIDISSAHNLASSLRKANAKLVINMAQGVFGHVIAEIDNYLRYRLCENMGSDQPCVFLGEEDALTAEVLSMYEGVFEAVSLSAINKKVGDHVANCHPDLTIDIGLSSSKVAPPSRGYAYAQLVDNTLVYRTGYLNGAYWDHIQYYKRLKATAEIHPMRLESPCPDQLGDFVDKDGQPIVLIQQRQQMSASNKVVADDELYVPALEYLREKGYTAVFVGREVFPEKWNNLGVINYANSPLASISNDFHLFRLASFALLAASGTNLLAETQATPYLQINNAQGANPPFAANSIYLPSMWASDADGKICTALDHIRHNLHFGIAMPAGMHAQSASAQDILEGVQELENLIEERTPRSALQQRWVDVGKDLWEGKTLWGGKTIWEGLQGGTWIGGNDELLDGFNEESHLTLSQSRVAQKFLEKRQDQLFS